MVSFLRLQSPTVVSFFHHLKFWFLADGSASFWWPKLFLLFLERQQRQHFFPKAVADLGQFYLPRVLQPAYFVLCLTQVTWEQIFPFSQCPCPILGAFCCLHPVYVPFLSPFLPSVSFPLHGAQPGHLSNPLETGHEHLPGTGPRWDRPEVEAWKKNCTAPFLTQGEEKMFLLAFVFLKSAGWHYYWPCVVSGWLNSGMVEGRYKKQLEELGVIFNGIKIIWPFRQRWKKKVIF